jgi:hypothetical protein
VRRLRAQHTLNATFATGAQIVALVVTAAAGACDAGQTKFIGSDSAAVACAMTPGTPPSALFPPFYEKYLDAHGIPVLSSGRPNDEALVQACFIAVHMLAARDDVREAMIAQGQRIGAIALDEVTTDLPEYSDLYAVFPGPNWDALRGVGATLQRPMSSFGEENMLCASNDPYHGENVLVQTFASAVLLGVENVDNTFSRRLQTAFDAALGRGLWQNTFVTEGRIAYYQMGVQIWFDASRETSPPDGLHNDINTRDELRSYDPGLAALVAETMPDDSWRPKCP